MPIELAGTITLADLVRFQYFHAYGRIRPAAIVWLSIIAAGVIFFLFQPGSPDRPAPSGIEVLPPIVIFAGLALLPWWNAKRQYSGLRLIQGPIIYTFSSTGYTARHAQATSQVDWSVISRIQETATLFILYQGPMVGVLVPKHFFPNAATMGEWRQLVESRIPIRKPGFIAARC